METKESRFFRDNPEGVLIAALDSGRDGLVAGAVELRSGDRLWLDYELDSDYSGAAVSFFRGAEKAPAFEYRAEGRRVDIVTPPDRLLLLWNRGRRALAVDGEPLSPGEVYACAPEGTTPWLLRFANWLPGPA